MMPSIKETAIRDYISGIDFNRDDWKLSEIKEGMRKFLGEEPGVDITYRKDCIINEVRGEAEEIKSVDKVSIIFFDLDERFKKLEFIIGDRL